MSTPMTANHAPTTAAPFRKYLTAGLQTGLATAVIANLVALVVGQLAQVSFAEITLLSVTLASIIPNLIGGALYYGLTRWTARPALIYSIIVAAAAVLDSVMAEVAPPAPGFGVMAHPLHLAVALTAILLMPRLVRR